MQAGVECWATCSTAGVRCCQGAGDAVALELLPQVLGTGDQAQRHGWRCDGGDSEVGEEERKRIPRDVWSVLFNEKRG